MNLRTQLKGTKMSKGESVQDYFTRISQIKEKLSAIGDILDEDELVMTALNGLTRPWDSFIQTLCARKESMKFDIVWEDCIQEEARVANRESLLKEDDQALDTHNKKINNSNFKRSNHKPLKKKFQKKKKKDYLKYQCYNCHKIGHLARECPSPKNNNNKRHDAHLVEDEDEERPRKRTRGEDVEEYLLFSALSVFVTLGEDTWLIDSGASKHMTGKKTTLSNLEEKNSLLRRETSYGLGCTTTNSFDTRNQSFPICKRNQTSNTEGYRTVPCSKRLKQIPVELSNSCLYQQLTINNSK